MQANERDILRWITDVAPREREYITLLAPLAPAMMESKTFTCLVTSRTNVSHLERDHWLTNGVRLHSLADFCNVARRLEACRDTADCRYIGAISFRKPNSGFAHQIANPNRKSSDRTSHYFP